MKMMLISYLFAAIVAQPVDDCDKCSNYNGDDFKITAATVFHNVALAQLEFEITVKGMAGKTTPTPAGQLDMAPVLGYVFPTTLRPEDVGFNATEGIVALALTSHPDFDDSPLWDENANGRYDDDGLVWHPHWVILIEDKRLKGGLSVKQFDANDKMVKLPPTAPKMPMYMDSPGFQVITKANKIRVVVPTYRINHKTDFKFDAVACYMQVSAPEGGHSETDAKPMLGVYNVYSVLSGNLSLPYQVKLKN